MRGSMLFVLLATTIVAGIAAAPATADEAIVLCKAANEPCKAESYAGEAFTAVAGTTFEFSGGESFGCKSTMSRDSLERLKGLFFENCGEGCSVSALSLPYDTELAAPSGGNGEMDVSNGGSGEPRLGIKCGANECVYGLGTVDVEIEGGKPAVMAVSESLTRQTESILCPKTATWDAFYFHTAPTWGLFVAKRAIEGPMFCGVNESVCPQESILKGASLELQPETSLTVTGFSVGPIECSESLFLLQDIENPYLKGPWRFKVGFIDGCTHPVFTGCEVKRPALTYYASLYPYGNGSGEVGLTAGTPKEDPALLVHCLAGKESLDCVFSEVEEWLEFEGGSPATVQESAWMGRVEGPPKLCPASIVVAAAYEVLGSKSSPVYMTET